MGLSSISAPVDCTLAVPCDSCHLCLSAKYQSVRMYGVRREYSYVVRVLRTPRIPVGAGAKGQARPTTTLRGEARALIGVICSRRLPSDSLALWSGPLLFSDPHAGCYWHRYSIRSGHCCCQCDRRATVTHRALRPSQAHTDARSHLAGWPILSRGASADAVSRMIRAISPCCMPCPFHAGLGKVVPATCSRLHPTSTLGPSWRP